jgi:hypothetical protein
MECAIERCSREAEVKGLCRVCYANERQKAKRRANPIPELVCDGCGQTYIPQRRPKASAEHHYCSRKCKTNWYNRQPGKREDTLRRYYLRRYGLTLDEVAAMRVDGCGICGRFDAPGRWEGNLHIDHDHETGKVRGVLCHGCNVSLGHFQHDPVLLAAAIRYLSG